MRRMNRFPALNAHAVKAIACALILATAGCTSRSPLPSQAELLAQYPCQLPDSLDQAPVPYPATSYQAFGDSITYGFLLPKTTQAYPYLLSADEDVPVHDYAIPGAQACDLAPAQILPHWTATSNAPGSVFSIMIGTNDAARDLPNYIPVFSSCLQAAVTFLGVPEENKIYANAPTVTTTGNGSLQTVNGSTEWVSTSAGSAINFPITLPAAGAIYLWMQEIDGDAGAYRYSVDGSDAGSGLTSSSPAVFTNNGATSSVLLVRIPNLPPGTHTVTVTDTASSGSVGVLAAGRLTPADAQLPLILLSDIPYARNTADTGCTGSATPSLRYMASIQSAVTDLAADGLNLHYVPTRKYLFALPVEMSDQVHPNTLGQKQLEQAFQSVWQE